MADFFESINLFYRQKKFCDLSITNLWPSCPNFSETVQCHSIVLSSAIPNLGAILQSCGGSEDVSIIIVQGESCASIVATVDRVYSSLSSDVVDTNPEKWQVKCFV